VRKHLGYGVAAGEGTVVVDPAIVASLAVVGETLMLSSELGNAVIDALRRENSVEAVVAYMPVR
jgi:hypothetical protein